MRHRADVEPARGLVEPPMISEQTIRKAVHRIVAAAKPTKVILFGSYARGDPDANSDLDLMVIEAHIGDPGEEMVRLHEVVGDVGVGVDVLVYSEQEASRRGQVPGTVIYWALREGRVLYDAAS